LSTFAPALVLGWLGLTQVFAVARGWAVISESPSWSVASEMIRSTLYATFVLGAATALLLSRDCATRDNRRLTILTSLTATFLMMGVSFLPTGPILWRASAQAGLVLSVLGAAIALVAFLRLGSNFSITPEVRNLVVSGPYRVVRHPIYFAELIMVVGVVVGFPRLTTVVGALGVLCLQLYRIHVEERLLRASFPAGFAAFAARTPCRLVPLLW
jgi:protein-S-isoprenylcysteine O-methyltransferase Ste14